MGNILIIEDERAFSTFLTKILEPYHKTYVSSDWEAGERLLSEKPIDIALVDLRLPKISGKSIVQILATRHPEVVPIIITAYENEWKETEAYSYGVYKYLIKGSFTPDVLYKIVNHAMLEKMERSKNIILKKELKIWDNNIKSILQNQNTIGSQEPFVTENHNKEIINQIHENSANTIDMEIKNPDNSFSFNKIINITGELSSKDSLDEILDFIVSFIKKNINAEGVSIMLPSEDCKYLYIKKAAGLPSNIKQDTKIEVGEGIAGKAFSRKKIISSSDSVFRESYFHYKDKGPFLSIPILNIPEVDNEKPIGVINITRKRTDLTFSEAEKKRILNIIRAFSIPIKNELRRIEIEKNTINKLIFVSNILESRNPYTHGHSKRVGIYASNMALKLGYSPEEAKFLEWAGKLHDIGKINIPDKILLKNGALTGDEYMIIKKHPLISREIVSHIRLFNKIQGALLHHHERIDGKGYPDGIGEKEIEIGARILAVADAYDAMTSRRPYRSALKKEEAIARLISGKNTHFDPECVDVFIEILKK